MHVPYACLLRLECKAHLGESPDMACKVLHNCTILLVWSPAGPSHIMLRCCVSTETVTSDFGLCMQVVMLSRLQSRLVIHMHLELAALLAWQSVEQ